MIRKLKVPTLRLHKPTKQYYVWHGGRRVYLSTNETEANKRYREFVADLVIAPPEPAPAPAPQSGERLTVAEACLRYRNHMEQELKGGKQSRQYGRVKHAMNAVSKVCGEMLLHQFKGKAYESVQRYLMRRKMQRKITREITPIWQPKTEPDATISRQYANKLCRCILQCWSWLVREELVPPENLAIMREVPFIREQEGVRESTRITPVSPEVVEATLEECHPLLCSMIRLQQLTGMRPGEICSMRRCDISTQPTERVKLPKSNHEVAARVVNGRVVWLYIPATHKTMWKRKPRVILIGPKAQEILKPLMDREPEAHMFAPKEALTLFRQILRENRKTPVQPSQRDRSKLKPQWTFRKSYTNEAYARAVTRAIQRANEVRVEKGLPPIPRWAPNQLRHTVATEVAERFDESTAAALIGHCGLDTIKIYAEQAIGKAAAAAAELG